MKWRIGGMEGVYGGSMFNDAAETEPGQQDMPDNIDQGDVLVDEPITEPQIPTETGVSDDEPYSLPGSHLGIQVEGDTVDFSNMYGGD
jgi:hypothetical protein